MRRRLLLGCGASTGVVVAHLLSYRLAAGHGHAELLGATGHGPTWPLAALLMGLIVTGLAPRRTFVRSAVGYVGVACRLAVLQLVAFGGLEVVERSLAGLDPAHLLHETAFVLGLAAQVLVAFLGASLFLGITAIARSFGKALPPRSRAAAPRHRVTYLYLGSKRSVARAAWSLRGPPLTSSS